MEPTSQPDSTLKVCLINKDLERETRVEIRAGRDFEVASRLRLAAPSAEAKTGGNAWQCRRRRSWPMVAAPVKAFPWRSDSVVEVPAASAVIVKLLQ